MRRIVLIMGTLALFCSTAFGQGAAPTSPSPFLWKQGVLSNTLPSGTGGAAIYLIIRNSSVIDTIQIMGTGVSNQRWFAPTDGGWWLGLSGGGEWDRAYIDTVRITTGGGFLIDGEFISRLDGTGLRNAGGNLEATLGTSIENGEIVDSTIIPADLAYGDTAFVVGSMHRGANITDSAYMTKEYIDQHVNGLSITSAPTDGQVMVWDDGANEVVWDDPPGAAGGDNITVDTGDAINMAVTDPVFRGSITKEGDTITFLGSAFAVVADTTYDWLNSRAESLKFVDVDSLQVDIGLTFPGSDGFIDSVDNIYGGIGDLSLISRGSNSIIMQGGTNGRVYINTATLTGWRFDNDTLFGSSLRKSAIKNLESINTDSITVGAVTLGGFVSGQLNPAMAARNVRDSLASYVLRTAENWRDSGQVGTAGDSVISHSSLHAGPSSMNLKIRQTVASSDTTYFETSTGSIYFKAGATSGDNIVLQGAAGNTVIESPIVSNAGLTLKDTVGGTSTNADINDVNVLYADTGFFDYATRFSVGAVRSAHVTVKGPATLTGGNYTLTLPGDDGTAAQALLTDGTGGLYWGSVAGGSGTGDIESVDAAGGLTGGGTTGALTIAVGAGTGITVNADDIAVNTTTISTVARLADTSLFLRDKYIPFLNYQGGTTYGNFDGSDSLWMLHAGGSGRMLTFTASHNTVDTTRLYPEAGDGLVIGNDETNGVTVLAEDTTRINGVLTFGGDVIVTDTVVDSMVLALGRFSGAASGGDIEGVGSMTTGTPFSDATADEDWLGLGAAAGRIQFEANNAGSADDQIEIIGSLVVGSSPIPGVRGIYLRDSSTGDVGTEFVNLDSANGSGMWGYWTSHAKTDESVGGDAGIVLSINTSDDAKSWEYRLGVDRSDSMALKMQYSDDLGVVANGWVIDTLGKTYFPAGAYNAATVADSAYATLGYVKTRVPYYNIATDIVWNYPTGTTDTSMLVTFPYVSTYDSVFLAKCSTITGNDTAFGLVIPFYIQDSCTIDSLVLFTIMSSATANNCKIDSVHLTWEAADAVTVTALTSYTTDIGGSTALTRTAIPLSRSAAPGEIIRARPALALTENNAKVIIQKAQIKGSRR